MEIVGYICCLVIGFSLGALGAGGSILTVPIMVYLLGVNPTLATTYSLVVVGVTAGMGTFQKRQFVDLQVAMRFGVASIVAVYATKVMLIPMFPEQICGVAQQKITMLLFALLMIVASYKMFTKKTLEVTQEINYTKALGQGVLVGILTGILGVGGGFLIVPSLVLYTGLEMRRAAATSLLVIAMNCLIGLFGSFDNNFEPVMPIAITTLSVIGMFVGIKFSDNINVRLLEKMFANIIAVIAAIILFKELFGKKDGIYARLF